jgi:hypothetical protein
VKAGELFRIYRLTEHLAQLLTGTEIRIQPACARTVFPVAKTSTKLASFPEEAALMGEAGQ